MNKKEFVIKKGLYHIDDLVSIVGDPVMIPYVIDVLELLPNRTVMDVGKEYYGVLKTEKIILNVIVQIVES